MQTDDELADFRLHYNLFFCYFFAAGKTLDSEDFIVSNLLLPGGSLIYLLFCTTKWGWGFDNYLREANTGKGIKLSPMFKPFFQFIIPALVLVILIYGLI